mmetsp:Transcript_107883/g.302110  ORF Transcript_107883/g.302110 Transcript_107883/m.302110 type:complete len:243 (+) Transcript_107883:558-1286(+)
MGSSIDGAAGLLACALNRRPCAAAGEALALTAAWVEFVACCGFALDLFECGACAFAGSASVKACLQAQSGFAAYSPPCLNNLCIACIRCSLSNARASDFFFKAAFSALSCCTIVCQSKLCSLRDCTTSCEAAHFSSVDFIFFSRSARSCAQRCSTEAFRRVMSASRRSMTSVWFVRSTCWTVFSNAALSSCNEAALPFHAVTSLSKTCTFETWPALACGDALAAPRAAKLKTVSSLAMSRRR